jgi:hypothetical protein
MYKNLSEIEMRVYRRASEEMNRKAKRNEDKKTGERERNIPSISTASTLLPVLLLLPSLVGIELVLRL